jgi:hypothetical protein
MQTKNRLPVSQNFRLYGSPVSFWFGLVCACYSIGNVVDNHDMRCDWRRVCSTAWASATECIMTKDSRIAEKINSTVGG